MNEFNEFSGTRVDLIERVAPPDREGPVKPGKPDRQPVKDTAELNDRLFEKAWRKSD